MSKVRTEMDPETRRHLPEWTLLLDEIIEDARRIREMEKKDRDENKNI